MELSLGFLASHNGSNVKAIVDEIENKTLEAKAKVVISNNPGAQVLELATERNIPYFAINEKNSRDPTQAILTALKTYEANVIILAGYMKKLGKEVLQAFPNRVLNIHPALLPKYGGKGMYGMNVHEAVIRSGDRVSGVTIHLVNEKYDEGKILAQFEVPRLPEDTAETLAKRVLEAEHNIYPQVLREIQKGNLSLD